MKIIYTLFIAILFSIGAHAQSFMLTFEDTNVINQVFYTDSIIDSLGVWQIGTSGKTFFDSAFGISTELDSPMPAGDTASFIITLPGVYYSQGSIFSFKHKYDLDTAHSGAYVEFSVDTGLHWHGVHTTGAEGGHSQTYFNDSLYQSFCVVDETDNPDIDGIFSYPAIWWAGDTASGGDFPTDTLSSGIAYFTGTDSVWHRDTIVLPANVCPFKTGAYTQFVFRFTVFADSLAQPHAGWMIDSIAFGYNAMNCICIGINEINSGHLHVYPNPATDAFDISILNEPESEYNVTLYDLAGRAVMQQGFTGQSVTMQRGAADAGCYFIQVTDMRTGNTFQKRVVFE